MRHAPLRRYEFSKYSFAFWQENRIRALTDYISMSRFWLPLITVLPFPREQVFHNRCNDTAVGNNADILFDFRECFQHPHFHLRTTFTSGRDVGFVVTGKPGLVLGNVFQLIVALHFKNTEIHFSEFRYLFKRHIPKQNAKGFIGPLHATGEKMNIFYVIDKFA